MREWWGRVIAPLAIPVDRWLAHAVLVVAGLYDRVRGHLRGSACQLIVIFGVYGASPLLLPRLRSGAVAEKAHLANAKAKADRAC